MGEGHEMPDKRQLSHDDETPSLKAQAVRAESPRLIWLQSFIAVAEKGSYAAAGRFLLVDETTIRSAVKSLESWLRFKLVRKNPPGERPSIGLTKIGASFLPDAEAVVRIMFGARERNSFEFACRVVADVDGRFNLSGRICQNNGQMVFEID